MAVPSVDRGPCGGAQYFGERRETRKLNAHRIANVPMKHSSSAPRIKQNAPSSARAAIPERSLCGAI